MTIGIGANYDSYMVNCIIVKRPADGVVVVQRENKDIAVRLDGYAIIPLEDYERMRRAACVDSAPYALPEAASLVRPWDSGPVRDILDKQ